MNTSVVPSASASTLTVWPGLNRPSMSAFASGFSTSRWMVRLSGRAPNVGSVPSRAISDRAAGVSSSVEVLRREPALEVGEEQLHDRGEVGVGEGVEHDDLVDPVQELRAGTACAAASVTWRFIASYASVSPGRDAARGDDLRADVAGHDHDACS